MEQYACLQDDAEAESMTLEQEAALRKNRKPVMPRKTARPAPMPKAPAGWQLNASEASRRQKTLGKTDETLKVGRNSIVFKRIPKGRFVMGSTLDPTCATPRVASIEKPFWMSTREVTNALYLEFDKTHKNGLVDMLGKDHGSYGYNVNDGKYPVIRISWDEATAFCKWLSKKTGRTVRLPTEEEWEYAARAGTATPFFFGDLTANFGTHANLADKTIAKFNWRRTHNYMMRVPGVDDKSMHLSTKPYKANAFGLSDMIGNVAEWTSSSHTSGSADKVARGGSWRDLPRHATASTRVGYKPYQRVFNVGIRLVMEDK
jgi:formylglycine-generating enzyme required for sulfatase activity